MIFSLNLPSNFSLEEYLIPFVLFIVYSSLKLKFKSLNHLLIVPWPSHSSVHNQGQLIFIETYHV